MSVCLLTRILVLLALLPVGLTAQEEATPRRRRIIVYDQRPSLIPVESPDTGEAEAERRRRIRGETDFSSGGSALQEALPIPSLVPAPGGESPQAVEEEEPDWITAEDLLGEEDLLDTRPGEDPVPEDAPEIDITAWEDLQRQMIEEEISSREIGEERMREQAEEEVYRFQRREEDPDATGLGLENMLDTGDAVEAASSSASAVRDRRELPGTRPVLDSAMAMGRQEDPHMAGPPREDPSAADPGPGELAGSRKLLEDIRTRWDPARRGAREPAVAAGPAAADAFRALTAAPPMTDGGVGSFSAPAPMLRRDPVAPPDTGSLGMNTRPGVRNPQGDARPSASAGTPSEDPFGRKGFRIRSRLGVGGDL